ncbi:MAG: alkaline phosphatase family protein [Phycisphaerae bacterium]|nr:alkaline phosphatase family protein [Phycisphaerae bacterium]
MLFRPLVAGASILVGTFVWSSAVAGEPKIIAGPMVSKSEPNRIEIWLETDKESMIGARLVSGRAGSGGAGDFVAAKRLLCSRYLHRLQLSTDASSAVRIQFAWATQPAGEQVKWTLVDGVEWRGTTPPLVGAAGRFNLAFGSCSHQEKHPASQPVWSAVAADKPDLFLFIGDNIYLPNDSIQYPATRAEVLKLYCDTYDRQRRMPELQSLLRSTYCFGLWDDHDYGPNNSDRTWQWKDVALEAFMLYFPGEYGLPDARGCFRKFAWGDVDIFMLDDRTFRDPNTAPDRRTFLGEKQLAWLKEGLSASRATFRIIVCGNQILSDTHPHEGWGTCFRAERDEFLQWLWNNRIGGVIFLAGDRHFAELVHKKDPSKKAADLWELTSSPLANDTFKSGDQIPNADRVAAYTTGPNYGVLEFDTVANPPSVMLKLKSETGKTMFQQEVRSIRRADSP